jgi:hypothetical protein
MLSHPKGPRRTIGFSVILVRQPVIEWCNHAWGEPLPFAVA